MGGVRVPDSSRLMRHGSKTNPFSWQDNVDNIKIASDYATLGRAFRNCFSFQNSPPFIHNMIILKTISSWKPLSREFTYKVISTADIEHTYFSLITLYVHEHSLILRYCMISDYIHHFMICLHRHSNFGLSNGFVAMLAGRSFVSI